MAPSATKLRLRKPTCLNVPSNECELTEGDTKPVGKMSLCEILPRFLFLGGIADACDPEALNSQGITHILSLTHEADKVIAMDILHKHVPMDDSPEEDIEKHFEECFSFVNKARAEGGRILVHCQMGISRAPTIVIAFLMKHHQYSYLDAMSHVKAKRPIISPRLSFLFVLEAYEQALAGERLAAEAESFVAAFSEFSMGPLDGLQQASARWEITTGPAWE